MWQQDKFSMSFHSLVIFEVASVSARLTSHLAKIEKKKKKKKKKKKQRQKKKKKKKKKKEAMAQLKFLKTW